VALLVGMIVLGFAWNLAGALLEWHQPTTKALPAYLPYFAAGMLAALWVEAGRGGDHGRRLTARVTAGLVAGGAVLVLTNGVWHRLTTRHNVLLMLIHDMPAAVGFALVITGIAVGAGVSIRWARSRWLTDLGVVSYGFYLWHVPLLLFAREMTGIRANPLELGMLVAPLALLAGAASWVLVERPLLSLAGSRLAVGRA
jgi:peptidoglycan/LPS O-acetylase OafA/YrhL